MLAERASWEYVGVDLLNPHKRGLKFRYRASHRLALRLASTAPTSVLSARALMYGSGAVARIASSLRGDFYWAQQQACLPTVASVAHQDGVPYGCDIEDILSESSSEPRKLISAIEQRFLPGASVVTTMSNAAAQFLKEQLPEQREILATHNTPALSERQGVPPPVNRPKQERPSIYWFGQTLGPHSLGVDLIKANASAGFPFRIRLRGLCSGEYKGALAEAAVQVRGQGSYEILPYVAPTSMVRCAAEEDVLFGSQPSTELFHQLAIGNKVFTGLAAGNALLLTSTIAHRALRREIPEASCLYELGDAAGLTKALHTLAHEPSHLAQMQQAAWQAAESRFNWDIESKKFVEAVERVIGR